MTATTGYDAFGNATNPSFPTRYQFTGRENDPRTGLMHYRARQYDPKLGRFISEDPIGFAGGDINLYGYVYNRPYTFRDPTGNIPVVPLIYGGIIIGGLIIASSSPVNAPGPNSPIYFPDNPLILNAAGGPVLGSACKVVGRFASPLISRLLAGTGDDIINLGVSQGPLTPKAGPTFLGQGSGPAIPIPNGATPKPNFNPNGKQTGFKYTDGSGGQGLDPRVTGVRIMNPTPPRGASPGYPNGYVTYMNGSGQTVNPLTGQTVPRTSPWAHIPLEP